MLVLKQLPPLSLYIHIPWCVKKCPYCDFNSHTLKTELPEEDYIHALITDLQHDLPFIQGRSIHSIFIGGGTPSLFSGAAIHQLISQLQEFLIFSPQIEITLEANPGTVEQHRFADFYAAGINRISLGIQSFQDEKLNALGRIHNANHAKSAAEAAKNAGFTNLNLDLMFGLPEQSIQDALDDLQTAIALDPTHISWYQLTLEPNTLFHARPPLLPHDDLIWEMQLQGQALLKENGYAQYEVSAYAKINKQSQHNLNYWLFGDYLGIGAGAHGKITQVDQQSILRTVKEKHPKIYLAAKNAINEGNPFLIEQKTIASSELAFEFMLNALRLQQAIPLTLFTERTGLDITTILPILNIAQQKSLIKIDTENLLVMPRGQQFLNELIQLFLD